jgi:hypothetical protein
MSKKLRKEPINIASDIVGWLDENNNPHVFDERSGRRLDARNIDHKITIYERQVKDWFLIPATNLTKYKNKNKGFIVLMICLSYLEGIEQYRKGQNSNGQSKFFFVSVMERIYPNKFQNHELEDFYSEARCGLFHNGMVRGRIIINNEFQKSIEFVESNIKISPSKFLKDIKEDFENYLQELRTNEESRNTFDKMYSNI